MKQAYLCDICDAKFYDKDECLSHERQPVIEGDFHGLFIADNKWGNLLFLAKRDYLPTLNLEHERLYSSVKVQRSDLSKEEFKRLGIDSFLDYVSGHAGRFLDLFTVGNNMLSVSEIQKNINSGQYSAVSDRELNMVNKTTTEKFGHYHTLDWFNSSMPLNYSGLWRTLQKK